MRVSFFIVFVLFSSLGGCKMKDSAMKKDPISPIDRPDHSYQGISREELASLKPGEALPGNLKEINKSMIDKLKPGESTLDEISIIFPIENHRSTYEHYPLKMKYKGKVYEIYRIIGYFSGNLETSKSERGVSYGWGEKISLTAFFDRNNTLLFYFVSHAIIDYDEKTRKRVWRRGPLGNFTNKREEVPLNWSGSRCADALYQYMYEGNDLGIRLSLGEGCLWEEDYHAGNIPIGFPHP